MLLYLAALVIHGATPLPPQPADVPWPTTDWPVSLRTNDDALERMLAVTRAADPILGETRAVIVVQHGRIVVERYMPGYDASTRLISWSMAKSVTQALLGIAVKQGLVDLSAPMGHPRWSEEDPRSKIPWRQWITMVDGQEFHEIDSHGPVDNDSARMLFGVGRNDIAAFAAGLPLVATPGERWNYNSGGINLIASGLGRLFAPNADAKTRRARVAAVLKDELFSPIGMRSPIAEFDATGTLIGSALIYATARDWARFGLLYLRDGVWDGRRILPEGWVDFARTKTPASNCDIYGAGFWVVPQEGPGRPFHSMVPPSARDTFFANGHEGQFIAIVPSRDIIVVRLGRLDDRVGMMAAGRWVAGLIEHFADQK